MEEKDWKQFEELCDKIVNHGKATYQEAAAEMAEIMKDNTGFNEILAWFGGSLDATD